MSLEPRANLPWQGLVALAAAVAGALLYFVPLDTSRPPDRTGISLKRDRAQDVDARLWQDPLIVAYAHDLQIRAIDKAKDPEERAREEKWHSIDVLKNQILDPKGRFWILPVFVPGGSYIEQGEIRLRTRRAVLEALGTSSFSPEDGEHIGYVRLPWPPLPEVTSLTDVPVQPQVILPYEWCESLGTSSASDERRVLILWLRDEEFQDRPLAYLNSLLGELFVNPRETPVRVIGPRGSSVLNALVREVAKRGLKDSFDGITIFSPTATASEEWLLRSVSEEFPEVESVEQLVQRIIPSLKFHRTTRTDAHVCRALIMELAQRGVSLQLREPPPGSDLQPSLARLEGNDDVALISEWDTLYGRALPLTFAREVSNLSWNQLLQQYPANIHPYHYLRGIDGMVPGAPTKEPAARTDGNEKKTDRPRETTEGLNQADYLRRLATQLQEIHRRLQWKGGRGLKAVGVLGSDVYDKLLVLKALRRALPGVLFFTNNLDARLAHPDEWAWTRNLIVASPFDLQLAANWTHYGRTFQLQGKILPFRDSYQTATYAATLFAANEELLDKGGPSLATPRLFEIGRSGPYPLGGLSTSKAEDDLHPDRNCKWWNKQRVGKLLLILLLVAALVTWVNLVLTGRPQNTPVMPSLADGSSKDEKPPPPVPLQPRPAILRRAGRAFSRAFTNIVHGRVGEEPAEPQNTTEPQSATDDTAVYVAPEQRLEKGSFCSLWAVFVCVSLLAWWIVRTVASWQLPDGEPFAWTEGISLWPTEIIRLTAIIMTGVFFWRTREALKKNEGEVQCEFGLVAEPEPIRRKARVLSTDWWDDQVRRLTLLYWRVQKKQTRMISAHELWNEYVWSGKTRRRFQRIVPPLICYIIAAWLVVFLLGVPAVPYRGVSSFRFDRLVLFFSVAFSTALTFYVADATILNRRLIHYLTVDDTKWEPKTYSIYYGRRKLSLLPTEEAQVSAGHLPPDELLCDYLEIELIAKRTEAVTGLIYYPFVVLFLMIVSRMGIFDNWDWPVSLILVLIFNGGFAAWSAFRLRNTAERARTSALQRLGDLLVRYTAAGKGLERHVETIREMLAAIRAEKRGAFAPISQHPILGAILLPSGGLGIWAASQYLPKFFE